MIFKIGDAELFNRLIRNQVLFGWVHAVQNPNLTNVLLKNNLKCIAWEEMYEEG